MSGPYRDAQAIPRFLCIVCYRSLSAYSGDCPRCGVPRLDLSDPRVREQVRGEAEKRLQRRMLREYSMLSVSSAALVAPAMWWLGALAFVLVPPVTMVMSRAYAAIRRNSAIATYASRRQRISAELGVDVRVGEIDQSRLRFGKPRPELPDDKSIAMHADTDPLQLEMERLLEWLGAELDDPPKRD
ncbi:MAG TPA: hypothetical protein VFF06_31650 [Polyangia bacterium]|nr:hypothetical protein [Polyangia bacterium]